MKEKFLLYISLACSVAGLILLYYISQVIELPQTNVREITVDDIGKNVKICGEVISESVSKTKHVFLTLNDTSGEMDVVVFNSSAEKLNAYDIKKGDAACVIGSINDYQGNLEIIAKGIER